MVHLCEKHLVEWKLTPEETILAKTRTMSVLPKDRRPYCLDCRSNMNYPLFHLCAHCARKNRICQQCSRTTLTQEEQEAEKILYEAKRLLDRIIDDYTLIIKTYGFRSEIAALFREEYPKIELATLLPSALDARTDRPIWKEVLGSNIYQKIFCDRCEQETIQHGFRPATECEHVAVGRAFVMCHLCAVRARCCAACGETP